MIARVVMAAMAALISLIGTPAQADTPAPPEIPSFITDPLARAAFAGDVDEVRHLVFTNAGRRVNTRDAHGGTPLIYAIAAKAPPVVDLLLRGDADPNLAATTAEMPASSETTPLLLALDLYADTKDAALIVTLLDHDADPNLLQGGETALTVTARKGYVDIARLLLQRDADPTLPRADGVRPADIARQAGFPAVAALIDEAAEKRMRSEQVPWNEDGVQLRCDAAEGTFEIVAYVHPRDGDDVLQKGFKGVKEGTSLRGCNLGKRAVLAQIVVTADKDHGADDCKRGGRVEIPSLSVDGVELEEHGETLTWPCYPGSGHPAIVRITVRSQQGGVSYALCTTRYEYDGTRTDDPCKTRSVAVDQQAAAFAKIDHDLADPAVQAAQSATRLPASLDMAQAFATQKGPDQLPICAHWVQFAEQNEDQPWARIGGKPGERTPIYPIYPRACRDKSDHNCDSTAYVIAGDRVDIGAVCGPWTSIRYSPRVRAFPTTRGWVETARLYGVQEMREPPTRNPSIGPMPSREKDPLNRAADRGDTEAIANLLRNGIDPNGPDGSGKPLLFAVMNGNLPVVKALLAGGATPDPGVRGWNRVGMSALMQVAKNDRLWMYRTFGQKIDPIGLLQILVQHGAVIDATDTYGQTPLLRALRPANLDVVAFLLDAGADPNRVRSTGDAILLGYTPLLEALSGYRWDHDPEVIRLLLAHGADPNFRAEAHSAFLFRPLYVGYPGETALTIAAREGYMTVVRDLLDHGADPTLPRGDGALPADIAREAGFSKLADLLRQTAMKRANPPRVTP